MKKLLVALLALLALVAFTTYAYWTPQLTLKDIRAAAQANDTAELARHIDFDAVRASLKQQIQARIDQGAQQTANPLAALGSALAGALTEPAVDALVTPENVAQLLRGEAFGSAEGPRIRLDGSHIDMRYDNWDTFVISTGDGAGFGLILEREGFLSWRLTDLRLPQSWSLPAPSLSSSMLPVPNPAAPASPLPAPTR